MTHKYYYALKQQEKHNRIPLDNSIKPFKYWIQVSGILLVVALIIIYA
jgi:hypothetical protein